MEGDPKFYERRLTERKQSLMFEGRYFRIWWGCWGLLLLRCRGFSYGMSQRLEECLPRHMLELLKTLRSVVRESPGATIFLTGRPHATEDIPRYFS